MGDPYEGLAFNNGDYTCSCKSGPGPDGSYPSCNHGVNQNSVFLFSRLWTNDGGGVEMTRPTDLSTIGQAKYDVSGTVAPTGMNNETIDFGAGDKVMTFGGTTLQIMDGLLTIRADGTQNPGDSRSPGTPAVTLPSDIAGLPALGVVNPDYWLLGCLWMSVNGGPAIEFFVCESSSGCGGDDEEPSEPFSNQPYNTLNVGNNPHDDSDGLTDLAMFLYMKGEEADKYYTRSVTYVPCTSGQGCETRNYDGVSGKTRIVYGDWVLSSEKCQDLNHDVNNCNKEKGNEYVLKLALWGEDVTPSTEVPAPAALSLFGLGLIGLGTAAHRRRQAA